MPERDDKAFLAALAGLLHDVGKFAQRGAERGSLEGKDAAQMYGHYHAMLTDDFLKEILPFGEEVRLPAANHHVPQSKMDWVIKAADVLSAGERADPPQGEDDRAAQPRQLLSIFSVINADGVCWKEDTSKWRFFPLEKLALKEEVIFPGAALPDDKVWSIYEKLWADFKKEAEAYKSITKESEAHKSIADLAEIYIEAMLALLQRYGWCMPSAYYRTRPDVSLYDHSRMTAALAACLVDFPEDKLRQIAENAKTDETDVALLVGGDISGVQDFIYTITNKGATSALRGRSFYLQLLTEAAARFVLRELGLPYTNLIYGGGGNFYLLARATDAKELPAIRQKLSRVLYKHHQGDLYVAIEGIPLKAKDFMRPANGKHPLSEKWGELARAVAVVKNRRFAELDADELKILFKPQGHGGNDEKQCQVCGCEHPDTRLIKKDKDDEGVRKCPACLSYEKLGEDLRKAQFIGWNFLAHPEKVADLTGKEISSGYEEALKDLGFEIKIGETFDKVQTFSRVWALNDDAFEKAKDQAGGKVLVRRLLVNVTPIISREEILQLQGKVDDLPDIDAKDPVKPFGAMAYQSQGITRLGVFRADVDNLGKLFAEGLGNDATLSRIASLSFSISLFFEGWVGEIAKRFNEDRRKKDEARKAEALQKGKSEKDVPLYGDALYAIYSGGDDLFFVGSWDELVEFAWQVNEDLHKYTGGHSGIHISGGMVLVTEKYPLAKAAKDAEKAESAAKNLTWWDENGQPHKKNVFSFLGQPLPWSEFANARELKGRLGALDDNKRTAVIRKLLMNYDLYAEAEKKRREKGKDKKQDGKPQTLYGPWNWRILYLLRRNLDKNNAEHQELTDDFHVLPDEEKQPNYARLEWVGVAARWMELKDR
ncbi:MAG: type III-A CRISPR-associated protein Cas10/Csm1 [Chloroflexota bacterium]